MKDAPKIGDTYTYEMTATLDTSASRFQDSSPEVFATPFLVGAVEAAGARFMEPYLAEGQMSVGGHVEISHTAPTPLGWKVTAAATLVEQKGGKFVFDVACADEAGPIGTARHTRFVVDEAPFMEAVEKRRGAAIR